IIAILGGTRAGTILVVATTVRVQDGTGLGIHGNAEVRSIIRASQEGRPGRVAVVIAGRPTVGIRPARAAAGTILHGDDGGHQLGIDLQLLRPRQASASLLEVALLHVGHGLVNPATRLVAISAAVG